LKYNAPFGNSNDDAGYVNGNPETGVAGSIPPAASIEYPQREIVNFVSVTGLTPSNSDLMQLAKAVQIGRVNYGIDVGAPNAIAVTPVLPVAAYVPGLRMYIKVGNKNTSQVTVALAGLGAVPLLHSDLSPLLAYELGVGQLIEVCYDGTNFQMVGGGSPTQTVTMTAPAHLYVNASTGDDTLYDGTSAAVSGGHGGPFRTVQKALSVMARYNLGGWDFYIHVADGVYANAAPVEFPLPNGSGVVHVVGNTANPVAASIFNTAAGSAWKIMLGGNWSLDGFSFRTTNQQAGDQGNGIWGAGAANITLGAATWNSCYGDHFLLGPGGSALIAGPQTIVGGSTVGSHLHGYTNGVLVNGIPASPLLTITAAVAFPAGFVCASQGGQTRPIYSSITGASNVTGPKFKATLNGVIDSAGQGVNYLPGNSAGILQSGGQWA